MERFLPRYLSALAGVLEAAEATRLDGGCIPLDQAIANVAGQIEIVKQADRKVMFIGNGGSAGIASHMAVDFTRNGGVSGLAFNDGAALTCIGNDFGYEEVFRLQIAAHARKDDLLFAISSSGRSANILRAVGAARERGCSIVTLSGFTPDNPLRSLGDLNLYVPSNQYGLVEISHLALIHAALDLAMGWQGQVMTAKP